MIRTRGTFLLIGAFIMAFLLGGAADPKPAPAANDCNPRAAAQLPASVVQQVNGQRAKYGMSVGNSKKTLKTQVINQNWQAVALTAFLREYCGFVGYVEEHSTTAAGRNGAGLAPGGQDYIVIFVGKTKANSICVSNTVPTVRETADKMILVVPCDREYSEKTWLQTDPQLTTPPSLLA